MRTDTTELIGTLRSIAECDPACRDAANEAADRMEELAFVVRQVIIEGMDTELNESGLDVAVEFMASEARNTLNGGPNAN